ncbi:MAG: DNA gyrase subunit A, partial [Muribaculaceae bacterium]|nr:DNA gyrase subunit A [Muribaculaceae bacterium]
KGVKTISITEKTGNLVAIMNVSDANDLVIINQSGIAIRLAVADVRVMGRATQGVKLIDLSKRDDTIASVCKVSAYEEEKEGETVEEVPADESLPGAETSSEAPADNAESTQE